MLSVIVITKNESHRIRRCLASVQWADEIIVLDSGSTDNTCEIAREYTPHVLINADWQGYGVQKQRVLSHATGQWILHVDADEWVDETLKIKLLQVMEENKVDACRVPIRLCFYDKPLRFSSSPTRHARFFKREGARFSDDLVHEKIILPDNARIQQLKTPLFHDSFLDMHHAIEKMNKYSSYSAHIRLDNKKRSMGLPRSFLGAFWMFVRCYLFQGGFLDGQAGLILAILNAEGSFYRGIKQIYQDKNFNQQEASE
ncbi:MAG: glycosyltransferase family 2 protein [Gammaproteobacteria bacterium]|nr:glycosyltransferase family 2 protein [Gammaproteobacteria bacterium]MCH9715916.1 glycosyltransferase family 2 protein [Gammaproteobacteria bacterium]MCH9762813.1 glycosyltransferase family 2 protein [Gammaproteobacteria bacterium]